MTECPGQIWGECPTQQALSAECDRLTRALQLIAVGEIPGQYDHDLSAYAHDVLKGGGELQVFPGRPA